MNDKARRDFYVKLFDNIKSVKDANDFKAIMHQKRLYRGNEEEVRQVQPVVQKRYEVYEPGKRVKVKGDEAISLI